MARLFHPGVQCGRERRDAIRQLSYRLLTEMPADLPVRIFVSAGRGRYERNETPLYRLDARLDAMIAEYASVRSSTFTIVLDVTDTGGEPRFSVASANGLAG